MVADWSVVLVALFAALPPTLIGIGTLIESMRTTRAVAKAKEDVHVAVDAAHTAIKETADAVVEARKEVNATHEAVNGKMDKLLELTAKASYVEGELAGNGTVIAPVDPDGLKALKAVRAAKKTRS